MLHLLLFPSCLALNKLVRLTSGSTERSEGAGVTSEVNTTTATTSSVMNYSSTRYVPYGILPGVLPPMYVSSSFRIDRVKKGWSEVVGREGEAGAQGACTRHRGVFNGNERSCACAGHEDVWAGCLGRVRASAAREWGLEAGGCQGRIRRSEVVVSKGEGGGINTEHMRRTTQRGGGQCGRGIIHNKNTRHKKRIGKDMERHPNRAKAFRLQSRLVKAR